MQVVASLGHVYDVLAVQCVVSRTSAASNLLNTQAVLVVLELDGFATLNHTLELAAFLPGVSPGAIVQRVANGTEKAIRKNAGCL